MNGMPESRPSAATHVKVFCRMMQCALSLIK